MSIYARLTPVNRIQKYIAIYSFLAIAVFVAGSALGKHTLIEEKLTDGASKLSAQVSGALGKRNTPIEPEVPVVAPMKNPGNLAARGVMVLDISRSVALFEKNSAEKMPLASITKLMTALVTQEYTDDDSIITVTRDALNEEGDSTLFASELWKSKDLVDFMLITSSNDAAVALAKHVGTMEAREGEGPRQAFVRLMNERADGLGLTSIEFIDETGLDTGPDDAGAYGNARDIAYLLSYIIKKKPALIEATMKPYETFTSESGITHAAQNTNDAIPAIPSLLGGKTGYTDLAGGNLVIVFDRSINEPVAVVVLGSTKESRFTDVSSIVDALLDQ